MATESYTNNASTTLNGAVNNAVTSIVVTSATGFPASGQYRILIDSEYMLVTGGQGTTTWTVTRGAEGSTAASHLSLAAVTHVLTAGAIDQIRQDLHQSDVTANRPAAAKAGNLFLPTDGPVLSRDGGSSLAYWGPLYPITPPVAANFAWQNQGSASLSTAGGVLAITCPTTGADAQGAQVLSLPAAGTAYTYTALINVLSITNSGVEGGMLLSDGTKNIVFFCQSGRVGVRKYTNSTTFSANYYFPNSGGSDGLMWYRIADNGGLAASAPVSFQLSQDGLNWGTVATRNRADFLTETKVGWYLNANGAGTFTTTSASAALLSWAGP